MGIKSYIYKKKKETKNKID